MCYEGNICYVGKKEISNDFKKLIFSRKNKCPTIKFSLKRSSENPSKNFNKWISDIFCIRHIVCAIAQYDPHSNAPLIQGISVLFFFFVLWYGNVILRRRAHRATATATRAKKNASRSRIFAGWGEICTIFYSKSVKIPSNFYVIRERVISATYQGACWQ